MGYKYCCCGIHVHVGTFVIALICLLYSLVSMFAGASVVYTVSTTDENSTDTSWPEFAHDFVKFGLYYTIGSLIESLLLFLTSLILIWGNRSRKPALYWPFIIYQILSLLIALARMFAIVYVFIDTLTNDHGKTIEQRNQGILVGALIIFVLILLFCFQFYFVWVVVRGRKFLVEERRIQKSVNNYNPYHSGGTLVDPYYQYHRQWNGHRHANSPTYVYY